MMVAMTLGIQEIRVVREVRSMQNKRGRSTTRHQEIAALSLEITRRLKKITYRFCYEAYSENSVFIYFIIDSAIIAVQGMRTSYADSLKEVGAILR